ncbi:hypothetical protein LCGC14_0866070 [marine sediment metagenome]|uniref:Uncharacterized protein n=1 Tax=marine sediment metagenome TaxID=412755 RepID=A0A0F9PRL8_9ZZZZ
MTTVPPGAMNLPRRVVDIVRDLVPRFRNSLSPVEQRVAIYLRGNENLFEGLKALIELRIQGRANVPEPSDPIQCKSMLARDREIQSFLTRLEFIYKSPIKQPAPDDGEPPE